MPIHTFQPLGVPVFLGQAVVQAQKDPFGPIPLGFSQFEDRLQHMLPQGAANVSLYIKPN